MNSGGYERMAGKALFWCMELAWNGFLDFLMRLGSRQEGTYNMDIEWKNKTVPYMI
jgi:hypothetical protein